MITNVFVRWGDVGLDIVKDGGPVGEPGDEGMETERLLTMLQTKMRGGGRERWEGCGDKERVEGNIGKFAFDDISGPSSASRACTAEASAQHVRSTPLH